jgi:Protein of unknown function (DUF2628)
MLIYTVHEPPLKAGETVVADPDRFVFVRDRFAVWAFLLTPLWLLVKRQWLVLLLYLLLVVALSVALVFLGTGPQTRFWVLALISFLVGLEAPTLQRWTLARRKWRQVGIVIADDREDAERRFFARWTEQPRAAATGGPKPETPSSPPPAATGNPTTMPPTMRVPPQAHPIGLFPEPGAGR